MCVCAADISALCPTCPLRLVLALALVRAVCSSLAACYVTFLLRLRFVCTANRPPSSSGTPQAGEGGAGGNGGGEVEDDRASMVSAYTFVTQTSLRSRNSQPDFQRLPAEYDKVGFACVYEGGCG